MRPAAQGEEQVELEVFGRGGHASMPPHHGSVPAHTHVLGLCRVFTALDAQGEEQLELEVFGRGGHASMPPRHGSVLLHIVLGQGLVGCDIALACLSSTDASVAILLQAPGSDFPRGFGLASHGRRGMSQCAAQTNPTNHPSGYLLSPFRPCPLSKPGADAQAAVDMVLASFQGLMNIGFFMVFRVCGSMRIGGGGHGARAKRALQRIGGGNPRLVDCPVPALLHGVWLSWAQ